jgi:hypothetical protein
MLPCINKVISQKIFFIFFGLLLLYRYFPSANSSLDSYYYAACAKHQQYIFQPFHLLYTPTLIIYYQFIHFFGCNDLLAAGKLMNAMAATGSIVILYFILVQKKISTAAIIPALLCCAFCFGQWRYATENETYILPVFFSLLASFYFEKYFVKKKKLWLFIAGVLAATACLFHVIHFFWWLVLLVVIYLRERKFFTVLHYAFPALIVPIAYALVLKFYFHQTPNVKSLIDFFNTVLTQDSVSYSVGVQNIYLSAISLFRTFFQVHGYIFELWKSYWYSMIPAFVVLLMLIYSLVLLWKDRKIFSIKMNYYFPILLLQFLFAAWSQGNAEFMVMLPFLFLLAFAHKIEQFQKVLLVAAISFFLWNFSYGIVPMRFVNFNQHQNITGRIIKEPGASFVLSNAKEVQNQIFYHTGTEDIANVYALKASQPEFKNEIAKRIAKGEKVYTDIPQKTTIISRAWFTSKADDDFFSQYKLVKVDSFACFKTYRYLFSVEN